MSERYLEDFTLGRTFGSGRLRIPSNWGRGCCWHAVRHCTFVHCARPFFAFREIARAMGEAEFRLLSSACGPARSL
jgi:hypothetical protein